MHYSDREGKFGSRLAILLQQDVKGSGTRRHEKEILTQTNGKVERLLLEYERHRGRFDSRKALLTLYNNRIQGALD